MTNEARIRELLELLVNARSKKDRMKHAAVLYELLRMAFDSELLRSALVEDKE